MQLYSKQKMMFYIDHLSVNVYTDKGFKNLELKYSKKLFNRTAHL